MDLQALGRSRVLSTAAADVAVARERARRRRLWQAYAVLAPVAAWSWVRMLTGHPVVFGPSQPSKRYPTPLTVTIHRG